ncbi:MAG: hypothetical protein P1U56_26440 [Saprospiraceae bacterium]|nr:hypothetical protein [Saprospiraceae bacterium]
MNKWVRTVLSIWLLSISISSSIIAIVFIRSQMSVQYHQSWYIVLLLSIAVFIGGIKLYMQKLSDQEGIRINPKWVTLLYDFINGLMGILGSFLFLNLVLVKLNITPLEDEDFGLFMGTYYFLLGVPFVALYTCRIGGQTILISNHSIESKSVFSSQTMKWADVKNIELHDEYIVQGRVGLLIPRKLQKQLIFEAQNEEKLIINEPQTKHAKEQLFKQMIAVIPENIKPEIKKAFKNW